MADAKTHASSGCSIIRWRCALLLRTLRLNCLTDAYADLWAELYDERGRRKAGRATGRALRALGRCRRRLGAWDTPLRTEYERRAALVEIDALVAVWLGLEIEESRCHLSSPGSRSSPTTRTSCGSTPTAGSSRRL